MLFVVPKVFSIELCHQSIDSNGKGIYIFVTFHLVYFADFIQSPLSC